MCIFPKWNTGAGTAAYQKKFTATTTFFAEELILLQEKTEVVFLQASQQEPLCDPDFVKKKSLIQACPSVCRVDTGGAFLKRRERLRFCCNRIKKRGLFNVPLPF